MGELLQAPATAARREPGFAARHIGPSDAEQAEFNRQFRAMATSPDR